MSVYPDLLWIFLLEADDSVLMRIFNEYISTSSRNVAYLFLENENDDKRYEW